VKPGAARRHGHPPRAIEEREGEREDQREGEREEEREGERSSTSIAEPETFNAPADMRRGSMSFGAWEHMVVPTDVLCGFGLEWYTVVFFAEPETFNAPTDRGHDGVKRFLSPKTRPHFKILILRSATAARLGPQLERRGGVRLRAHPPYTHTRILT